MQIVNETFYPNYKMPAIVYKVRVRKEYKISEKGLVALKSGKIHTPLESASCGINLQLGKLYVLSGRINSLRVSDIFFPLPQSFELNPPSKLGRITNTMLSKLLR